LRFAGSDRLLDDALVASSMDLLGPRPFGDEPKVLCFRSSGTFFVRTISCHAFGGFFGLNCGASAQWRDRGRPRFRDGLARGEAGASPPVAETDAVAAQAAADAMPAP
jgi:hypothetical protein